MAYFLSWAKLIHKYSLVSRNEIMLIMFIFCRNIKMDGSHQVYISGGLPGVVPSASFSRMISIGKQ